MRPIVLDRVNLGNVARAKPYGLGSSVALRHFGGDDFLFSSPLLATFAGHRNKNEYDHW
jgi:hypothetical protein